MRKVRRSARVPILARVAAKRYTEAEEKADALELEQALKAIARLEQKERYLTSLKAETPPKVTRVAKAKLKKPVKYTVKSAPMQSPVKSQSKVPLETIASNTKQLKLKRSKPTPPSREMRVATSKPNYYVCKRCTFHNKREEIKCKICKKKHSEAFRRM